MVHLDPIERAVLPGSIGHRWWSYLAEGILLVLLGIAAIIVPIVASIAFAFLVGIITIIAGPLLAGWPVHGAFSLTIVLAAYLFAEGIASIGYAWTHRHHIDRGWAWMLFNGIVDLIFGGVSLIRMGTSARNQLPGAAQTAPPATR